MQILEILGEAPGPLSAQQLAEEIGVSRPVVYRLLRTLELHGLLDTNSSAGRFDIGVGLLTLARKAVKDLRGSALPELQRLTRDHSATSYVGVRDGDEIVCVLSCEPDTHALAVRHREGMRVPMKGAASWVLLAAEPPSEADVPEIVEARRKGYTLSEGQVFPGALAVSAPILRSGTHSDASLTLVFGSTEQADEQQAVRDVVSAAQRISDTYTL